MTRRCDVGGDDRRGRVGPGTTSPTGRALSRAAWRGRAAIHLQHVNVAAFSGSASTRKPCGVGSARPSVSGAPRCAGNRTGRPRESFRSPRAGARTWSLIDADPPGPLLWHSLRAVNIAVKSDRTVASGFDEPCEVTPTPGCCKPQALNIWTSRVIRALMTEQPGIDAEVRGTRPNRVQP
jgi:hypothetical protein